VADIIVTFTTLFLQCGILATVNCILPGGTIIICISKLLNKGTSNSCIYACMQIIQYTLIEIVHEFYAQSVIALCTAILKFILLIYIVELNKIASHCDNIIVTELWKITHMGAPKTTRIFEFSMTLLTAETTFKNISKL